MKLLSPFFIFISIIFAITTLLMASRSSSSSSSLLFALAKDLTDKRPIIRPLADSKTGRVNRTFLENDEEIARFRSRLPPTLLKRSHPSTRVVAIGDLHGDVDAAKEILRISQVTNDLGHWNSGTDTVIQMGDVLDRGPHGFLIMDLLERLKQEARAAGGELIQLMGNHELMNYLGDFRFVHPKLIEAAGGLEKYSSLVQQGGKYGKIIANLPATIIRNGTLFVHAGLTEINVRQFGSVDDINSIMRRVLNDVDRGHAIVGEHGPIWTRQNIYGALAQKQCQVTEHGLAALTALELTMQDEEKNVHPPGSDMHKTRVHRMVIGHTIMTEGEPRTFCNGALFAIDVEMSAYMPGGGYLAYYEQLKQSVEGVQPITLFTLPRGTWKQHPALWYPKPNTTDFGEIGEIAASDSDPDNDGHVMNGNNNNNHDDDGHENNGREKNVGKKVRMVAVRNHRDGAVGGLGSSSGLGLFRGSFLFPVIGVVALLVAALIYAVIKRYRLFGLGNHQPKHAV